MAPKGVKRVGVALSVNEKNGCSVMITLDMLLNEALPPFIIFTGVFGAILMKEYQKMTKATVLFTETHWMTSATNMLYFKYLSNFYKGKKVGLVYDKAPSHCSKGVNEFVKNWNDNPDRTCTFVIDFVDPCLTSVYQPPDVMYNKPFKALIRTKYNESISTELNKGNLNIGDKYKVSRDDLIDFICQTIDELNEKYKKTKQRYHSFEQCGLNHLCDNTDIFKKHLDGLTETFMYKALTEQHEAVTLSNENNIFSNDIRDAEIKIDETNISTSDGDSEY